MAYSVTGTTSTPGLNTTASWVAGSSRPRRLKFYDFVFGSQATPADNAFLWSVQRITAAGTGTSVTPQPLDPADFSTESLGADNHTIEPTYTAGAILLQEPMNQRATVRWVARERGELITPATAANGLGIKTPTASAVAVNVTFFAEEL